jgi:ABC-2 type transport system permease protein
MTGLGQVWTLVAHQLSRRWRSLLAWGVGLGAVGALYAALFPSMSGLLNEFMESAPESLKRWLGAAEGPMTPEQWLGMEFLNMLVPLALPFLVMLIGTRAVAGDEERKNLDLLLGNPLRRRYLVMSATGTMAIALTVVLVLTWVLTYVAVVIAGVDLGPDSLAAALVALWPMCLLFGTFSLFLSTLVRRAFLATVIPAVILVIMYLLELLAQLTETMETPRVVSLFYHIGKPIEGEFHLLAALLMLAGACMLTAGAAATFSKRDIYT